MKKLLPLVVPAFVLLAGCQHEEPAVPLSPQAQEALRTGHTGPPPQANQGPGVATTAATRGGDAKKPGP